MKHIHKYMHIIVIIIIYNRFCDHLYEQLNSNDLFLNLSDVLVAKKIYSCI
jgi:hypothetical protein